MPAVVKLSVTSGPSAGREFAFPERSTCIAGRAQDCEPRIAEDPEGPQLVSRHHCLFDVNPPDVRVRDFGSLNGTLVNGEEIGRRQAGQTPEEGARNVYRERDLVDGDEVGLGTTVLRVTVAVPTVCTRCSAELPGDDVLVSVGTGAEVCGRCRSAIPAAHPSTLPDPETPQCGQCGRSVSDEVGRRRGELVCSSCRADPGAIVRGLLSKAGGGDERLVAIRGYAIVRELGRGGQGVVYLARGEETGELIALKVMLAEVAVERSARDRFLREIESTRALVHPNVAALRDSGSSGGTFFLGSEYCDGGSLDHFLSERGGRLPVEEAVEIVTQVLDGLAYAHVAHGIVHRDIKPPNILLSRTGPGRVAKLGDFGLSKAFDQAGLSGHTRTGEVGGTVAFMARKQIIDFKYAKPEVDVWAAAATLYYLLTGALPRDFPAGADPIMVVLRERAVPIRKRDPSIPRKLASVIDDALVDNPQINVCSAADLKRSLQDAV
jgi:serine/threonine-protein kinase